MSTDPVPAAPATPAAPPAPTRPQSRKASLWRYIFFGQSKTDELAVYHHSTLYYWWPVWLFGFIMAGITYFGGMKLAIVPDKTEALPKQKVILNDKEVTRNILLLPEGAELPTTATAEGGETFMQPTYYVAKSKGWGTVFVVILLIVTFITNVTLRGLWSFLVLIVLVMVSLLATAAGWWEGILARLGQMAVYLNLGGYLLISLVLFTLWALHLFIFDRQTYMIFTPGQVRLCLEIGGGETVYDTSGMVVQKERGDLFRHWVLGFGSGDLIIRPMGVANPINLTNVLHVGRVVRAIELMVKERVILSEGTKPDRKGS